MPAQVAAQAQAHVPTTNSPRWSRVVFPCCNIGKTRSRPSKTATKGSSNSTLADRLYTRQRLLGHWLKASGAVAAGSGGQGSKRCFRLQPSVLQRSPVPRRRPRRSAPGVLTTAQEKPIPGGAMPETEPQDWALPSISWRCIHGRPPADIHQRSMGSRLARISAMGGSRRCHR